MCEKCKYVHIVISFYCYIVFALFSASDTFDYLSLEFSFDKVSNFMSFFLISYEIYNTFSM